MKPLLFAGTLCAVFAIGEAICAGKNPQKLLQSLKQPSWVVPTYVWYFIGLVYYAACFVTLYRIVGGVAGVVMPGAAIALLLGVMTTNAFWNALFFRWQNRKLSFWYFVPYTGLVVFLIGVLATIDRISAFTFVLYLTYLPYALVWTYRVWRLNE